jgi:hypothetical protein
LKAETRLTDVTSRRAITRYRRKSVTYQTAAGRYPYDTNPFRSADP